MLQKIIGGIVHKAENMYYAHKHDVSSVALRGWGSRVPLPEEYSWCCWSGASSGELLRADCEVKCLVSWASVGIALRHTTL